LRAEFNPTSANVGNFNLYKKLLSLTTCDICWLPSEPHNDATFRGNIFPALQALRKFYIIFAPKISASLKTQNYFLALYEFKVALLGLKEVKVKR
jgi:hypothetical protein